MINNDRRTRTRHQTYALRFERNIARRVEAASFDNWCPPWTLPHAGLLRFPSLLMRWTEAGGIPILDVTFKDVPPSPAIINLLFWRLGSKASGSAPAWFAFFALFLFVFLHALLILLRHSRVRHSFYAFHSESFSTSEAWHYDAIISDETFQSFKHQIRKGWRHWL